MKYARRFLLICFILTACRVAEQSAVEQAVAPPEWSRTSVIYEINVRQFTPEGTFRALEQHLPRLDSLGVDLLWLMPIQPIGVESRKGELGSYYSISDYTAINPEFGTAEDVRAFVDAAHQQGMKVILDWVANHTAFDHAWITEQPNWYARRADGTISFPRDDQGRETDWTDVAELDFDDPELRLAMIAEMRWWLENMDIDGFRFDVAWGVPMDFWLEVQRELTAVKPELFMLAEAEGPEYHAAFHATYGWAFHHLLNEVAQGSKRVTELDAYFARDRRTYPPDAYRMYFTSNHDENSWAGTEFERMGENHLPAFVISATAQNSLPLLYTGQEASLSKRLRFFEKDTVDWSGPSLSSFYRAMFDLKRNNEALWNGARGGAQTTLRTAGGERVYAFTRTSGSNTVLVAVNFADSPAQVTFSRLPIAGEYTDWFTKTVVTLPASGRLEIPANGYRVLVRERGEGGQSR